MKNVEAFSWIFKWFNSKKDILKLKQIHQRQEFKREKPSFVIAIIVI